MFLSTALSAQAAGLTSAQISAIIGLLQAFGADSSTIATVQAELNGQVPAPSLGSCSQFANLKRGDTDATTGGEVSQLQSFVGISPATGYYGVHTSIAYTNKCLSNNASPDSVPGMSKYTDPDFGFSFWYPSGWTVSTLTGSQAIPIGLQYSYYGATITKKLLVSGPPDYLDYRAIRIDEVSSSNMSITDTGGAGPFGSIQYFFDGNNWEYNKSGGDTMPTHAVITTFVDTMGGLHMFDGTTRYNTKIIPLSASKFVVVNDSYAFLSPQSLAKTIVATDSSVAIPVSTAEQIATIQAEASAYGVSGH